MANRRIPEEKLLEMFAAYCEKQSLTYVSNKCGVSFSTAKKYRDERGWDQKRQKATEKATEKVAGQVAERTSRYVKIAEAAIAGFGASVVGSITHTCAKCGEVARITVPRAKITAGDFERLVRLIKEELSPDKAVDEHVVEIILRRPKRAESDA